ncbi:hypothetical protein CDAR_89271 [Caerostris darwini]|uniref:Uncharacterized protein n=1 Tax=Caerostris darwini TaxID=1538125 RepID=A0AAV4UHN0_9ARAC|nr:hypothetical protein CDAR_89271 [Caerostris darwini]
MFYGQPVEKFINSLSGTGFISSSESAEPASPLPFPSAQKNSALKIVEKFLKGKCDKRVPPVSLLLPISGYSFLLKNVLWAAGREIHPFSFRPGIRPLVFFPFLFLLHRWALPKGLNQLPHPPPLPPFPLPSAQKIRH